MVQITCIFMVMEIKIVWDQLADRAARLKVLPFASFMPQAVVGWKKYNSIRTLPRHSSAMSRCAADWAGAQLLCRSGW